ncbi:hypothetical protein ACF0H5_006206 [Mactra antiquata]
MDIDNSTLQIFHPADIDKPLCWISDLPYWKRFFHVKGEVNQKHMREITQVIDDQKSVLKKYRTSTGECIDENSFMVGLKTTIRHLKQEKNEYKLNAEQCFQMEKQIEEYKDINRKAIESYSKQLKIAYRKLIKRSESLEVVKKMYMKFMFRADKAGLKLRMLSEKESKEAKMRSEFCKRRGQECFNSCMTYLEEWNKIASDIRMLSMEYETAYTERELARAELVIAALKKLEVPMTVYKGKYQDTKTSGIDFNSNNVRDSIEFLATSEDFMFTLQCPTLQEYDESKNLDGMYDNAKKKTSTKEEEKNKTNRKEGSATDANSDKETDDDSDSDNDSSDNSEDKCMSDEEFNKQLREDKKFKYFVVTKEYIRKDKTELNLRLGERVKQLLPANENGMAFGKVTHGLLKKKKKGYYPVECTKYLTTLDSSDKSKNEQTKKKIKKLKKEVRKMKTTDENTTKHEPVASTSTCQKEIIVPGDRNMARRLRRRNKTADAPS